MATVQHNRTTAASILQIGFSGNTKCPAKDGYCRDSHIWLHIHLCLLALVRLLGLPLITHMAKHMTLVYGNIFPSSLATLLAAKLCSIVITIGFNSIANKLSPCSNLVIFQLLCNSQKLHASLSYGI